jgi:hypothetical protein
LNPPIDGLCAARFKEPKKKPAANRERKALFMMVEV